MYLSNSNIPFIYYTIISYYSLVPPAAPCSYLLPVSAAPAVPLAIPLFLAISLSTMVVCYKRSSFSR